MAEATWVVLNPKAGAGAALARLDDVTRELSRGGIAHEVKRTEGPGDATRIAREAVKSGVETLAVIGGDGTLNEVVQAYVDGQGKAVRGPAIAVVPAGTGGDYKRSLGLTNDVRPALARLRERKTRPVDLGALWLTDERGDEVTRAFLNITSFGLGGITDKLVNEAPKWMGGKAAFYVGTVRAMLAYKNANVRVEVDGEPFFEGPIMNVAIALGRFHGGGMKVAPDAELDDGLFDVIALGDLSRAEAIGLSRAIYAGTHLSHPKVTSTRGRSLVARPLHRFGKVLIDMDGETPGSLPLRAEVLPRALEVLF